MKYSQGPPEGVGRAIWLLY